MLIKFKQVAVGQSSFLERFLSFFNPPATKNLAALVAGGKADQLEQKTERATYATFETKYGRHIRHIGEGHLGVYVEEINGKYVPVEFPIPGKMYRIIDLGDNFDRRNAIYLSNILKKPGQDPSVMAMREEWIRDEVVDGNAMYKKLERYLGNPKSARGIQETICCPRRAQNPIPEGQVAVEDSAVIHAFLNPIKLDKPLKTGDILTIGRKGEQRGFQLRVTTNETGEVIKLEDLHGAKRESQKQSLKLLALGFGALQVTGAISASLMTPVMSRQDRYAQETNTVTHSGEGELVDVKGQAFVQVAYPDGPCARFPVKLANPMEPGSRIPLGPIQINPQGLIERLVPQPTEIHITLADNTDANLCSRIAISITPEGIISGTQSNRTDTTDLTPKEAQALLSRFEAAQATQEMTRGFGTGVWAKLTGTNAKQDTLLVTSSSRSVLVGEVVATKSSAMPEESVPSMPSPVLDTAPLQAQSTGLGDAFESLSNEGSRMAAALLNAAAVGIPFGPPGAVVAFAGTLLMSHVHALPIPAAHIARRTLSEEDLIDLTGLSLQAMTGTQVNEGIWSEYPDGDAIMQLAMAASVAITSANELPTLDNQQAANIAINDAIRALVTAGTDPLAPDPIQSLAVAKLTVYTQFEILLQSIIPDWTSANPGSDPSINNAVQTLLRSIIVPTTDIAPFIEPFELPTSSTSTTITPTTTRTTTESTTSTSTQITTTTTSTDPTTPGTTTSVTTATTSLDGTTTTGTVATTTPDGTTTTVPFTVTTTQDELGNTTVTTTTPTSITTVTVSTTGTTTVTTKSHDGGDDAASLVPVVVGVIVGLALTALLTILACRKCNKKRVYPTVVSEPIVIALEVMNRRAGGSGGGDLMHNSVRTTPEVQPSPLLLPNQVPGVNGAPDRTDSEIRIDQLRTDLRAFCDQHEIVLDNLNLKLKNMHCMIMNGLSDETNSQIKLTPNQEAELLARAFTNFKRELAPPVATITSGKKVPLPTALPSFQRLTTLAARLNTPGPDLNNAEIVSAANTVVECALENGIPFTTCEGSDKARALLKSAGSALKGMGENEFPQSDHPDAKRLASACDRLSQNVGTSVVFRDDLVEQRLAAYRIKIAAAQQLGQSTGAPEIEGAEWRNAAGAVSWVTNKMENIQARYAAIKQEFGPKPNAFFRGTSVGSLAKRADAVRGGTQVSLLETFMKKMTTDTQISRYQKVQEEILLAQKLLTELETNAEKGIRATVFESSRESEA